MIVHNFINQLSTHYYDEVCTDVRIIVQNHLLIDSMKYPQSSSDSQVIKERVPARAKLRFARTGRRFEAQRIHTEIRFRGRAWQVSATRSIDRNEIKWRSVVLPRFRVQVTRKFRAEDAHSPKIRKIQRYSSDRPPMCVFLLCVML